MHNIILKKYIIFVENKIGHSTMKKIKKIVYVAPIVTIGGVELYANDESWTWSQFAGNVVGGAVGGAAGAVAGTAVAAGVPVPGAGVAAATGAAAGAVGGAVSYSLTVAFG